MCVSAAFLLIASAANICRGFNVDTQFPDVFQGPSDSYFGYSVALHRNSEGPVVLVGAPKANSTTLPDKIFEPGALFRCNLSIPITDDSCKELALLKEGNTATWKADDFSYHDKKDGMWLGVSLDVRQSAEKNDVVVCGHLWKNKRYVGVHLANGVCYIIDADLDEDKTRKLLPMIQKNRQYTGITGKTEYEFAYGQAGISAIFSEDTSNLILGAPGFFSWTGSFVNYPIYRDRKTAMYKEFETAFPPYDIQFYAYFGYSVTSGKFFGSQTPQYAVGAPRDDSHHGKVYVVRNNQPGRMYIQDWKRGSQLGEYFGASVLGIDVNRDSFAELLVGAPLHSTEFGGDEGKVYVYLSNGKELIKQTEIAGERKPGARFGTAIANLGDVNQDGFMDIAVGAPYEEGHGAVYIYQGSKSGLHSRYVQKIEASAINGMLKGFGIHISRGLDIDDNGYPDILVGSYASSQAVLFRSRPVIKVYPKLSFDPKQIVMNVPCENSLTKLTCVQINSCIDYTGAHVPPSLEFKLSVLIQDRRNRAFFEQGNSHDVSTTSLTVSTRRRECFGFRMYLRAGIKDVLTPIPVIFSHELRPPAGVQLSFDKTFPIYHPGSITNVTSQVPFQTGCGKMDVCRSNLNVLATRSDAAKDIKFISLGTVPSVSVEIAIGNTGEPAYMSELHIYLPPGLSAINQDRCESGGEQQNASLVCDIGNPLRNDTKVVIQIKLDISNLPPQTNYLGIDFEVVTVSTETDLEDNTGTIPLYFKSVYDIGVSGTSSVDQVMYDGTEKLSPVITHTYIVRNYGPSPLQTVYFDLDIPYEVTTESGIEHILILNDVDFRQRTAHSVPVSCDVSSLHITTPVTTQKQGSDTADGDIEIDTILAVNGSTGPKKSELVKRSVKEVNKTLEFVDFELVTEKSEVVEKADTSLKTPATRVSCDNSDFRCVTLQCTASSLYRTLNYAEISVSFEVNYAVLDKFLGRWYHLELITNSVIRAEFTEDTDKNAINDVAQVKTDVLHEGPPPPEEVESWIIFVSVGIGILVLIIILILLIKIGFFRRKEKDKMKLLKSDSKKEKPTTNQDDEVTIKNEDELEVASESTI